MEQETKKKITPAVISGIFIVIFVVLMVYGTVKLWPYVKALENTQKQIEFRAWIDSFRWWGLLIMIGLQVLQVVIAFCREVVEVVMGMMYGVIGASSSVGSVLRLPRSSSIIWCACSVNRLSICL